MDNKQFEGILVKIEDMKKTLGKIEENTRTKDLNGDWVWSERIPTTEDTISNIKDKFFKRLDSKTGWGKNEIKQAFLESTLD